jgi:LysM repeat protein
MIATMTERGLRSVDSAPACPFVAFEDDREARSTSPDHRHRCYAELVPSPRAAAHQEAYCLSSAFPVCPTFQDWARREAAHARGEGDRPRAAVQVHAENADGTPAPAGEDMDDLDDDSSPEDRPPRRHEPIEELPPIRRNPPRDWAAPPPWASGGAASAQTGSTRRGAGEATSDPPTFLAGRADESRGLAGSAADRLVGGASYVDGTDAIRRGVPADHDDELAALVVARSQPERPDHEYLPPSRGARRPTVSSTRNHQRERERERDAIVGPSWERARRYEAYPTIRSRAGLPALPRLAVLAGALVIAAVALFFLPALLGVGGGDDGGGPTAAPSSSQAAPSVSVAPTTPPEPTPQVYLVKAGDTLSGIATSFDLTLEELLAANPQITDPDKVGIGDEITIPAAPPSEFIDPSAEPSAAAS